MKILILDDDTRRANGLAKYLSNAVGVEQDQIDIAPDVHSATELVKVNYFDVLIIDVMIPRRPKSKISPENGIAFLKSLNRDRKLRKPGRILGITANENDITTYREEFAKHCVSITQASAGYSEWRREVGQMIQYVTAASASKEILKQRVEIITVHGIQTFGNWQRRFEKIASSATGDLVFHTYSYGIYSFFAFLVPFFRWRERDRLEKRFHELFSSHGEGKFLIFAIVLEHIWCTKHSAI